MNQTIADDVARLRANDSIHWANPILKFNQNSLNPYLPPDISTVFLGDIESNNLSKMLGTPGLEMDVDIPTVQVTELIDKEDNQSKKRVKFGGKFHSKTFETPYSLRSSCSFFSQMSPYQSSNSLGHLKLLSLKMTDFQMPFTIVEPILCSAFIFSAHMHQIISDFWYFTFPDSEKIMKDNDMSFSYSQTGTFQIDPKQFDEKLFLVIILSHPITVENSAAIIKYYMNPTEGNKQNAIRTLANSFPRIKSAFSQFAWSYIDLTSIQTSKEPISAQNFLIVEKPITEQYIFDTIFATQTKPARQIQLNMTFSQSEPSNSILRPRFTATPQPFLAPIHQISVRIKNILLKDVANIKHRNMQIMMSLRTSHNSAPFKGIFTPFSTDGLDFFAFGSCVYHDEKPVYNDIFVVNLPFPTPPTLQLCFEVIHVHAKTNKDAISQIGSGTIELVKDNMIISGDSIEVPITVAGNYDLSSHITLSIVLRSTFATDCVHLNNLRQNKKLETLVKVPPNVIVTNLVEILDMFVTSIETNNENFNLDTLFLIQNSVSNMMSTMSFQKYLVIYARFFALHDRKVIRGDNQEKNKNLIDSSNIMERKHNKLSSVSEEVFQIQENITKEKMESDPLEKAFTTIYMKLISSLNEFLNERPLSSISLFTDFIFMLIAKSLATTEKVNFYGFDTLCQRFCSIAASVKDAEWHPINSIAVFAVMLFDLGFAEQSAYALSSGMKYLTSPTVMAESLITFLDIALQPLIFAELIVNSGNFRAPFLKILSSALSGNPDYQMLAHPLSLTIVRAFNVYDPGISLQVASVLVEAVNTIQMQALSQESTNSSVLTLMLYIVSRCSVESLRFCNHSALINICHVLLNLSKHGERRSTTKLQQGILQFISNMTSLKLKDKVEDLSNLLYHLMVTNIYEVSINLFANTISQMITIFAPNIFSIFNPPLAKMLYYILKMVMKAEMNDEKAATLAQPFVAIFESDAEKTSTTNRAMVTGLRALSLLTTPEFTHPKIILLFEVMATKSENPALKEFTLLYRKLRENSFAIIRKKISLEKKIELYLDRMMMFEQCPDMQILVIEKISEVHLKHNLRMEYVIGLYLKAALILEYGCLLGAIPNVFGVLHCATCFSKICPMAEKLQCPQALLDDMPKIPCFCSSTCFSQLGLQGVLMQIFNYCTENKMQRMAVGILDILLPLLEYSRAFGECRQTFSMFSDLFAAIATQPPPDDEALVEKYYRVNLIGEVFGDDKDKSFVYHANRLTNVFALSKFLVESYSAAYNCSIELFQSASNRRLDSAVAYIDVTAVIPLQRNPQIGFIQNSQYNEFYFDTPFVPGQMNPQGTVETQWIRRTVITSESFLPNMSRRAVVDHKLTKIIDYEPIRVSYRMLRDRTKDIYNAIAAKNTQLVQQLLYGSLCAQVNEGPARIADIFMPSDSPKKEKLAREFKNLLQALQDGLEYHEEAVIEDQQSESMQAMMESSFENLKMKLAAYDIN